MAEDQILYKKDNGIGIITLNRPEKLNACTFYMYRRLAEIQEEIKNDDAVRVAILTGAGRLPDASFEFCLLDGVQHFETGSRVHLSLKHDIS